MEKRKARHRQDSLVPYALKLESSYRYEISRLKESEFLSHSALYSSQVLGLGACCGTARLYR